MDDLNDRILMYLVINGESTLYSIAVDCIDDNQYNQPQKQLVMRFLMYIID